MRTMRFIARMTLPIVFGIGIAHHDTVLAHGRIHHKPSRRLNKALLAELRRMNDADQSVRRELIQCENGAKPRDSKTIDAEGRLSYSEGYIDASDTAVMERIVARYGWPGRSLVGIEGEADAWTLVQHADYAPAFQERCLPLITEAARRGESVWSEVALLTDRVLLKQGKKQLYGTQFQNVVNGQVTFKPITDAKHLEERRRRAGLPSLADYEKEIVQAYGRNWPVASHKASPAPAPAPQPEDADHPKNP